MTVDEHRQVRFRGSSWSQLPPIESATTVAEVSGATRSTPARESRLAVETMGSDDAMSSTSRPATATVVRSDSFLPCGFIGSPCVARALSRAKTFVTRRACQVRP